MSGKNIRLSWQSRANAWSRQYPEHRIGVQTRICGRLPCKASGPNAVPVPIFGFDVPAFGNCLYHVVWAAAEFAGVQRPFGMSASEHVYQLRVNVGLKVMELIEFGSIVDSYCEGSLRVGDLVAQPDQYSRYSGEVPLIAMARMLNRNIVTVCADGIFAVTFCGADMTSLDPVVIYNCAVERVNAAVDLRDRNHYVPVYFANEKDTHVFRAEIQQRNDIQVEGRRDCDLRSVDLTIEPDDIIGSCKHRRTKLTPTKERDNSTFARDEGLRSLISRATTLCDLTVPELEILRRNFTKHPRLALLYFHCCGADPAAHVFNDETLLNAENAKVVERFERVLDSPVGIENVQRCQEQVLKNARENGDLWAYASCCEVLNTVDDAVHFFSLCTLHPNFELTVVEAMELRNLPNDIIDNHVQVLRRHKKQYHLNPELVPDVQKIPLCEKCSRDPRKSPFSIASGHD